MFDRWGMVEANHADPAMDIETAAIEAGAQEVQTNSGEDVPEGHVGARFLCNPRIWMPWQNL